MIFFSGGRYTTTISHRAGMYDDYSDHHEGVHGGKRKKPAKPSSGKKPARPSSGKTRPLSGYNKFVRKCSGTPEAKTRSGTHMMKYCAAQWNKLSKEEKLSYK